MALVKMLFAAGASIMLACCGGEDAEPAANEAAANAGAAEANAVEDADAAASAAPAGESDPVRPLPSPDEPRPGDRPLVPPPPPPQPGSEPPEADERPPVTEDEHMHHNKARHGRARS